MAVQPSVISEDLMSPQAMQGTSLITGNLNAAADRAAAAARQRAQLQVELEMQDKSLKTQQDLAEKELQSTALEHKKYQDFQAQESAKRQKFEEGQNSEERAMQERHQNALIDQQDKLHADSKKQFMFELDLRAKKARASADESDSITSQLGELQNKRQMYDDAMAGLETDLHVSQGQDVQLGKFFQDEGAHLDSSRAMMGEVGLTAAKDAIDSSVTDVLEQQKSGFRNFVIGGAQRAKDNPASSSTALFTELGVRLGTNLMDYFGADTPVKANALTSSAVLGESFVKNIIPHLAQLQQKGSPADLQSALTKFVATGLIAQQAIASDGVIKGADEAKVLKDFEGSAAELHDLIGGEAVQGIVRSMTGTKELATGLRKTYQDAKEMSDSEKKATKDTFGSFSRIGDVYNMLRNKDGSTIQSMDYDRKVTDFIPKLVEAHAKMSYDGPDFLQQMKRYGMRAHDIEAMVTKMKEANKPIPEAITRKMETIKQLQSRLDSLETITNRKSEAKGIKRAAEIDLEEINNYRQSEGL